MSVYADEVAGKVDAIAEAYVKYYDGVAASLGRELMKSEKPQWRQRLLRFDEAKPASAQNAASAMNPAIDALTAIAAQEKGTPIEKIQGLMEGWVGEAKRGFEDYLGELESTVDNQLQMAVAIKSFAEIQAAIVDAAQERAIEIADQTIAALGQAATTAAKARRERLLKIIQGAATVVGAILSAGSVGGKSGGGSGDNPISGILEGVSAMLTEALKPVAGASPPDIIDSMNQSIDQLGSALAKDQRGLREAMLAVQSDRLRDPDDPNYRLLPPVLGQLSPAGARSVVSITPDSPQYSRRRR